MAKQKAKITERFESIKRYPYFRRIWLVSLNGQSKVCYTKKEIPAAKAELEKG
jgi:hypothetical protein